MENEKASKNTLSTMRRFDYYLLLGVGSFLVLIGIIFAVACNSAEASAIGFSAFVIPGLICLANSFGLKRNIQSTSKTEETTRT